MTTIDNFDVELADTGEGLTVAVRGGGKTKVYALPGRNQGDFARFQAELAADFGTRPPESPVAYASDADDPPWRPLLTENIHPKILAG